MDAIRWPGDRGWNARWKGGKRTALGNGKKGNGGHASSRETRPSAKATSAAERGPVHVLDNTLPTALRAWVQCGEGERLCELGVLVYLETDHFLDNSHHAPFIP